jgi:anti-anti-sigma factor
MAMAEWPTRTNDSGAVVLRPEGRLNMVAAPDLREQLHSLVRAGNARLVVDLAAVETIDSSGLGALISGLKAARQAGGDLRISSPSEQATAVLELTNLNRVLQVIESPDSAFDEPI